MCLLLSLNIKKIGPQILELWGSKFPLSVVKADCFLLLHKL